MPPQQTDRQDPLDYLTEGDIRAEEKEAAVYDKRSKYISSYDVDRDLQVVSIVSGDEKLPIIEFHDLADAASKYITMLVEFDRLKADYAHIRTVASRVARVLENCRQYEVSDRLEKAVYGWDEDEEK